MRRRQMLAAGLPAGLGAASAAWWLWPEPRPAAPQQRALAAIRLADPPLRLACLGTSLTARATWPEALAEALGACAPVRLQRFAAPGMGSDWGLGQVAAVRAFAPHLALVEFIANDADLRHAASIAASRARHAAIVAALRLATPAPSIGLMIMNPAFGLRGLARTRQAGFEAMYATLAAGLDLGLVDTRPGWAAALAAAPRARLLPDGLHPDTAVQSAIMLEALLPPIRAALACPG